MSASIERPHVLVVDDELSLAETIADGLADRGFEATAVASAEAAAKRLEGDDVDALVTDLRMPRVDGLALLAIAKRAVPDRPVLVMTAYGAIDSAIESIRQGASHYLTKPFPVEELALFLARALEESSLRREARVLRASGAGRPTRASLVGKSRAMVDVLDVIDRLAESSVPVLLTGETGTGKGLVARTIHAESERRAGPFVTINCAALPEALLESELFGHEKGAFTGATRDRSGLVVDAHGGTLFLDEIGEMAIGLQAKLLDVLERRVVRPVGSSRERAVDVRVIAATHRDLEARAKAGAFREDLRYRLEVVSIEIPPLRRRRDDIPLLVKHFFDAAKAKNPGSRAESIAPEALARLIDHDWPGNVRELANAIERVVVLARAPVASIDDLPPALREARDASGGDFRGDVLAIREVQRRYAAWALEKCGGHKTRTAERLGIDLKTLAKWLSASDD